MFIKFFFNVHFHALSYFHILCPILVLSCPIHVLSCLILCPILVLSGTIHVLSCLILFLSCPVVSHWQDYTEEFRDISKGKIKESLPAGTITLINQRPVGEDLHVSTLWFLFLFVFFKNAFTCGIILINIIGPILDCY